MELAKEVTGKRCTYSMKGKFTATDTGTFKEVILLLSSNDVDEVVLDMRDVDFIDSAAMGMFLIAREQSEKNNKKIMIINAKDQPAKAFSVSKFDTLFDIV